ncbi:hypothetical protein AZF37_07345 [endosymbiont 'TC1' of Trimyema compressum]|uniref:InlB B-repeat-containing protein n=1 Tax=endosymbiont 'TC1' of Trimyema compressum TaxID=243899 RepID=UPI0007F08AB2|nr:InlB B-repeat-containing protein [endosymbiont 'TC1' of Trimyema compressum]AMP21000.1 hypothetical protein AZF37_07345 [endosymbiont 'TC1' of Trimyema compressum]
MQNNDSYVDSGGGISLYNTKATLINNTITNNKSETGKSILSLTQRGGGISIGGSCAVALKNNIIVGNYTYNKNGVVDTNSKYNNVAIPNVTESINNIGIDNGNAIDPDDVLNTFGTTTPELRENESSITAGDIRWQGSNNNGYSIIETVPILPSDGSVVSGLAHNAAGTPLLPQGQRGFTRHSLNSDTGSIEAMYVKFDGNGSTWSKPQMGDYDGTEYYKGIDPNAILKVSYVYGTLVAEDPPTTRYDATSRFKEWNTQLDGLGTSYKTGSTFTITGDTILYSIFAPINKVVYDGNGNLAVWPLLILKITFSLILQQF